MTVFAVCAWLAVSSAQYHRWYWALGTLLLTMFVVIPLVAYLAPKIDDALQISKGAENPPSYGRLTTAIEFLLYGGFISLVTYQSVDLGTNKAIWYGVPVSLTIGIIPQIASLQNRLYSILLSATIYAVVLWLSGKLTYFTEKEIHYYYLLVVVTAFSVVITEGLLHLLRRLGLCLVNLQG